MHAYAAEHRIPLIQFRRGQRKDDVAAGYRARFHQEEGVVFIGVAQEKASSFRATRQTSASGGVWFTFSRPSVAVNHIYFYVQDVDGGPAFVKIGTYLPYPVRVCLNGHEWAKQQPQWQELLAPCPELPALLREACARLDTALCDLRDTATAVLPRAA